MSVPVAGHSAGGQMRYDCHLVADEENRHMRMHSHRFSRAIEGNACGKRPGQTALVCPPCNMSYCSDFNWTTLTIGAAAIDVCYVFHTNTHEERNAPLCLHHLFLTLYMCLYL